MFALMAAEGCVNVILFVVLVQPLASVIVTEYVPEVKLVKFCVVAPLLQLNEYGVVPPDTEILTEPVPFPKQLMFCVDATELFNAAEGIKHSCRKLFCNCYRCKWMYFITKCNQHYSTFCSIK